MKILINFLLIIFLILIIPIGCAKKPEDIKLSELDTMCEHFEAYAKLLDTGLNILVKNKKRVLIREDEVYIKKLVIKMKDIEKSIKKKFTEKTIRVEGKECNGFDDFIEKSKTFSYLYRLTKRRASIESDAKAIAEYKCNEYQIKKEKYQHHNQYTTEEKNKLTRINININRRILKYRSDQNKKKLRQLVAKEVEFLCDYQVSDLKLWE